jgi:O-antigen ligase
LSTAYAALPARRDTGIEEVRAGPRQSIALSLACAVCGGLMQLRFGTEVGDILAGEFLLSLVGLAVFVLRGVGRGVNATSILLYGAAVFLMLLGYVISDLFAATESEQYVRGWARVVMLGLDILALLIIVSRGERHLRWFALGLALGIAVDLLTASTPFSIPGWKLGYGFAAGILLALFAGSRGRAAAAMLFASLGALSVLLDFRSLGGVLIVAAGILLAQAGRERFRSRWLARALLLAAALAASGTLLAIALQQSDAEYDLRRQESNLGRYVGVLVAARAVADSPWIGYGSWAGDRRYVAMLNQEMARATAGTKIRVSRTESILPHSQLLQAWVEGGILGALFFLIYGWQLLLALPWLALRHQPGRLTPLLLLFVVSGAWSLAASPFLGQHRVHIACAVAALALLARERTWSNARQSSNETAASSRAGY